MPYGGIVAENKSGVDLAKKDPWMLRMALHGCCVGAELAFSEGSEIDGKIMLARIEEIATELFNRTGHKVPRDRAR